VKNENVYQLWMLRINLQKNLEFVPAVSPDQNQHFYLHNKMGNDFSTSYYPISILH